MGDYVHMNTCMCEYICVLMNLCVSMNMYIYGE